MKERGTLILIASFILSLLFSVFFNSIKERAYNFDRLAKRFGDDFLRKESVLNRQLSQALADFSLKGKPIYRDAQWVKNKYQLYDSDGIAIVVSRADSILFLSHNAVPLSHYSLPDYQTGIAHLKNGWYYHVSDTYYDYKVWAFLLLKKNYRYKNEFLQNHFSAAFRLPEFIELSDNAADEGLAIYNNAGDFILNLIIPQGDTRTYINKTFHTLSQLLSYASVFFLLLILVKYCLVLHTNGYRFWSFAAIISGLMFLRLAMFYFQQPFILYQTELFSANHYAASIWLPSLGDLLLVAMFVFAAALFLFFNPPYKRVSDKKNRYSRFVAMLWLLIMLLSPVVVVETLRSIVINSSLELNVNFIFNLDIYHISGFLIITFLLLSFHFIGATAMDYLLARFKTTISARWYVFILLLAIAGYGSYLFYGKHFLLWFFLFVTPLGAIYGQKNKEQTFSLARLLMSLFVYAFVTTWALSVFNKEKEMAQRQHVALRIASEQDPVAEFLFHQLEQDLFDDHALKQLVMEDPYNEERILSYLKTEFFDDYWARYDIQLTTCAPYDILWIQAFEEEMLCSDYFADYSQHFGRPTLSSRFIYLDNNTGRNSYLVIIPIHDRESESVLYQLYLEFESRFIPRELGFPELLVDENIDITRNIGNYSYALYKDGIMTNKFGTYFFSIHSESYQQGDDTFIFFEADGYSHLLYNRDENSQIIVSKPRETILQRIAPFSYLFLFFLFASLIIWFTVYLMKNGFHFPMNFKRRLQISVIGMVLLSVVAIGSASAWFIFNIYKNKNEAILNEKAHSILIELESVLSGEPYLDYTYEEYLSRLLLTLSNVFFTDINIFDPGGTLIASSRGRVFNEGLISPIIHPIAFNHLKISGKSLFIHHERIGKLEYLSAYVPLRNMRGDLIAYINLPYFAQQSELRSEISFFLVAFINIYLLLLLLSVIIAFFISNHVTRPLQIIRDSISRLSIGKTNEKIDWQRDDEIGQLIGEYNRMIDELSVSADLLARSERESAWREMAKQVAHEIKNPLTPMRLNVQYLQRAWNDKVDDWEERLQRFTKTMVEQIDNLTVIAGEFSDFAKMPAAKNEHIDIAEFIPEVLDLYKGFDKVDIEFKNSLEENELSIVADRKQLLRVFNNLIKNAIQAYSRTDVAHIIISASAESNYCRIEIKDFGDGIADDLKKNIFQPYFTTKTAGMGLGLAMVKSIIQGMNGYISFESEQNRGTSFIIRLPLKKNRPPLQNE